MYKLVISDDEGKTTVVPLVRDEVSIGRREGNTIRLTERNVSRRHARLLRVAEATYVEDLGSYNGVRVNGARIDGRGELRDGDRITIGDYELQLQLDTGLSPDAPASPASRGQAEPPPRLVMLSEPAPGAEFALTQPVVRIGRAEDLPVWINHRSISREHAEILSDGGTYRIVDLGSSNGVRVNGTTTRAAVIRPGDVVELGQVRFRFVGEGESVAIPTEVEAPIEEPVSLPRSSKAPMLIAGAIVVVALVVGGAIAFAPGSPEVDEPEVLAAEPTPEPPVDAPPPTTTAVAKVDPSSRDACLTALRAERWDEAVRVADEGLLVNADDQPLLDCRTVAETSQLFARGLEALRRNDPETAHQTFEQLPRGSELRGRPEVIEASEQYARRQIAEARRHMTNRPELSARHAEIVLGLPHVPREVEREAERIRDMATEEKVAPPPRRVMARPVATTVSDAPGRDEPSSEPAPSGPSNMERARECMIRGDNACVVRLLEGRASSAQELALLIETYRTMGNTPAAVRNAQLFLRRYPSDSRAARYRNFVENQAP